MKRAAVAGRKSRPIENPVINEKTSNRMARRYAIGADPNSEEKTASALIPVGTATIQRLSAPLTSINDLQVCFVSLSGGGESLPEDCAGPTTTLS